MGGSGLGITSMIIGIVASILYWILPNYFNFLAYVLAFVGIILGLIGVATDEKKAFSIVGLILCAIILFFFFRFIISIIDFGYLRERSSS